jgi:photosystem II stability/assembly factor-like uncharacterized protein
MKKSLIICFFIFIVLPLSNAQGWKKIESHTTEWLLAISFPSPTTGYIAGWSGTILKTTDGGQNWSRQTSGSYNVLHSIAFVSESTGYIAGEYGTILKTTDGGASWLDKSPGINEHLLCIDFVDQNHGFAGGAAFLSTIDGGKTWNKLLTTNSDWYQSIDFLDTLTGFAATYYGNILKTIDGGKTWKEVCTFATWLNCIHAIDHNTVFAVGEYKQKAYILKTVNGGLHWTEKKIDTLLPLSGIHFSNPLNGYAVGGNGTILKTVNQGVNWEVQSSGYPVQWLNAVCFTDSIHGCIAATSGLILLTTTGGELGKEDIPGFDRSVLIYPDPVEDYLWLDLPSEVRKAWISVFDLQGNELIRTEYGSHRMRLDTQELSPGTYFLVARMGDQFKTQKFVKIIQ